MIAQRESLEKFLSEKLSSPVEVIIPLSGRSDQRRIRQRYDGQWDRFATVLIFILLLVTILDFFGEWLRGRITKP